MFTLLRFARFSKSNIDGISVSSFEEAEEKPAAESSTEEGESSDVNQEGVAFDETLEKKAQIGWEYLNSTTQPRALAGF